MPTLRSSSLLYIVVAIAVRLGLSNLVTSFALLIYSGIFDTLAGASVSAS